MMLLCLREALPQDVAYGYRVLATNKTSTMEKEMNEPSAAGFVFSATMGGETAFGGDEAVVVMSKKADKSLEQKRSYKLLATSKTSTMQKEMQQMADDGYKYRGQTVFKTTFGGQEVCVIMERNEIEASRKLEYKLLATSRTSTMQKELQQAGDAGFNLVGMTVAKTAFGGSELLSILERERK
jgi:PleD family two-component response regulator